MEDLLVAAIRLLLLLPAVAGCVAADSQLAVSVGVVCFRRPLRCVLLASPSPVWALSCASFPASLVRLLVPVLWVCVGLCVPGGVCGCVVVSLCASGCVCGWLFFVAGFLLLPTQSIHKGRLEEVGGLLGSPVCLESGILVVFCVRGLSNKLVACPPPCLSGDQEW